MNNPERAMAIVGVVLALFAIFAGHFAPHAPGLGEREE